MNLGGNFAAFGRNRVAAIATAALVFGSFVVVSVATAPSASAGPAPVMTGYVPLPADQFQDVMENVNTGADTSIRFTVGITNAGDGAILYYDQWEDGYDADLTSNTLQATTEVFGDGNIANGNAADHCTTCAGDLLSSGDVIIMRNDIPTPGHTIASCTANAPVPPVPLNTRCYDGRDKVASTRGFALTAGGFSTPLGSVLAGAVSAYDTSKFGTDYYVPVGENTVIPAGAADPFETTSLIIMASQANTTVDVDRDGDGTIDVSAVIGEGGVMYVDGGTFTVNAGAHITSDKPIQVHEGTGDVGSAYASRWFTLFPTPLLSNDYLNPVGSSVDNQRTITYLYNPSAADITVTPTCTGCSGTLTVPTHDGVSFASPLSQAVRFDSSGAPFIAVGGAGSQSGALPGSAGDNGQVFDWGFSLVPTSLLTTQTILGFAPGNSDIPPSTPGNADPVWATSLTATTLFVDYDGDPSTGAITAADCFGAHHDLAIPVAALASTRITDPNDFDMTGARIYTCDGTKIAGAWGEDPATAPVGSPGFDAGYALIPTTTMVINKTANTLTDTNGDGQFSPGDVMTYDVAIADAGSLAFTAVSANDALPAGITYVPNSTVFEDGVNPPLPIADDVSPPAPTAYPLDGGGVGLPSITAGATVHLHFDAIVDDPFLITQAKLSNTACVTAAEANGCDSVETPLTTADLSLTKAVTTTPTFAGDNAVFHLSAANAGPDTATGVEVTDLLPAGTVFVSSAPSQGSYDSGTGVWTVGSLAPAGSATLDITATINQVSVTNFAQITKAQAADIDSQPGEDPLGPGFAPNQDDEASATVTVLPTADLSLDKTLAGPVNASGNVTFHILVGNAGPNSATGVQVTDIPPPGATFVAAAPTQGSFSSGTHIWTAGTIASGASAALDVTYHLITLPSENFAQVSAVNEHDPDSSPAENPLGPLNPPDQDDEDVAPIPSSIDLSLTKVESGAPVVGGTVAYTVTVSNAGPGDATGVEVNDLLPAGLSFLSASPSAGSYNPGTGAWTVGAIAPSAAATLTLNARVTTTGLITNTAQVSDADQADLDSTPNNNTPGEDDQASAPITATASTLGDTVWYDVNGNGIKDAGEPGLPGVAVTVTYAGPDNVLGAGGDDVVFPTSTDASGLWSVGGLAQGNYRVAVDTTTLPDGLTTAVFDVDGAGTANTADLVLSGGTVRNDADFGYQGTSSTGDQIFNDLNANNTFDAGEGIAGVTVNLRWAGPDASFVTAADDIAYTATTDGSGIYGFADLPLGDFQLDVVTSGPSPVAGLVNTSDPDGTTDSATDVSFVVANTNDVTEDFGYRAPGVDLHVSKTDGGNTPAPGGAITYTIAYGNALSAASTASGVVLSETVPAGTTFDAVTSPGWSCADNAPAGTVCTMSVGSFTPGTVGSMAFAVHVVVPFPAGAHQISNTVTIADDGTHGTDPTPNDDTFTETTPVNTAPDLRVFKSDGGTTTTPGGVVPYTVAWMNVGNQNAAGVVVTETVPANTTFNAGASAVGWQCSPGTAPGATCTLAVGTVSGNGGLGNAIFAVTVDNPYLSPTTQINNAVTIADDGTSGPDQVPGDNGASDFTPVTTTVDLSVSKTDLGQSTTPDGFVSYVIGYANNGNFGADGVVLSETVPANSTFDTATSSPTVWSCPDGAVAGTVCTLALGVLAPGGSGSARFGVHTDYPLAPGVTQLSNTVTIAGTGPDGNPGNDSATETTPITFGTVGDSVFLDINANNMIDPGEGLVGVEVAVTSIGPDNTFGTSDDVTVTTTTGAGGTYSATGLPRGPTRITITGVGLPGGVTPSFDADGGSDDTSTVDLALSATDNAQDFGYVGTGSVGNLAYRDLDGDGVQDPGETGIANVGVTVTWSGHDGVLGTPDDVVFTDTTDVNGNWLVHGIPAGLVGVVIDPATIPAGLAPVTDPDATPDNQTTLTLTAGQVVTTVDFGYRGNGSIGDRVWTDTNGDGVQDAGEPDLSGALVTLTEDSDSNGSYETTVGTMTTNGTGNYGFANLLPGTYRITVDVSTVPTGSTATTPNPAGLVLTAGQTVTTADFGFQPPAPPLGSIGDTVFSDTNGNGVRDAGEPGLGGVLVTLSQDTDSNGSFETTVSSDISTGTGTYLFPNVPAGTYRVTVTPPSGQTPSTPTSVDTVLTPGQNVTVDDFGFQPPAPTLPGSIGDFVFTDTNGNGAADPGEPGVAGATVSLLVDTDNDGVFETTAATQATDGAGRYVFGNLPVDSYRVVVTVPAGSSPTTPTSIPVGVGSGENVTDADFALVAVSATPVPPGSIGDSVWDDIDHDGQRDLTETGHAGVTLTLRQDVDGDGSYETIVSTTVTDLTGAYSFGALPVGSYSVTATVPGGLFPSTPATVAVPLFAGEHVTDTDFGVASTVSPVGSIGDRVWSDTDRDGVQDGTEPGINGVTVTLIQDSNGDGIFETTVETTTTAGNGNYLFEDLAPGEYRVVVTSPAGMAPTLPDVIPISLSSGESVTVADVGLATPPPIPFDLQLVKTLSSDFINGQVATWKLHIRNNGIVPSPNPVTVTDPLPSGLTYVGFTGTGWSCSAAGQLVTCTLAASLAVGSATDLNLRTMVTTAPGTVITNIATVSANGVEITLLNNTDPESATVLGLTIAFAPPSTTTVPPTPTPSVPVTPVSGPLPRTGSNSLDLSLIALALVTGGMSLLAVRRRYRH